VSTETEVDWDLLKIEGVERAAHGASIRLSREFRGIVEYDDLYQDAQVKVATNPRLVRGYVEDDELGLLAHWLYCRLKDAADKDVNRSNRHVPIERLTA
jgi:hypothetical protein